MTDQESREEAISLSLSITELNLLRGAIRETYNALEDWEFETRMGCSVSELLGLKARLAELATVAAGNGVREF